MDGLSASIFPRFKVKLATFAARQESIPYGTCIWIQEFTRESEVDCMFIAYGGWDQLESRVLDALCKKMVSGRKQREPVGKFPCIGSERYHSANRILSLRVNASENISGYSGNKHRTFTSQDLGQLLHVGIAPHHFGQSLRQAF
ncbi:MAG: hypothetical protein BWY82_01980 [Verrucomicrobia bacterium ADurb.Bin474]|nr:MAG: hypothetical protein BWY82_01980 [Verrucomicrobia bacterium ADurb.Bin474]